jgi:hypothetical protein
MTRTSLDWLGERSRPHYGQLVLLCLLGSGAALCSYFVLYRPEPGPPEAHTGPATLLSWLPLSVLHDRTWSYLCGVLYALGALLWATQLALPWAPWLTALAYNAAVALFLENATQATHVGHLTGMILLLYALWYQFYYREIRAALAEGRFWATPLYPRWVYSGSVFLIGLFYGLSGLSKLLQSGPAWASGVPLQLWTRLFGDPQSFFTRLILADRTVAALLSWTTLIGETGGLLAIVSPLARPWIGLLLLSFHLGQIAVFGWGFHANMLLLTLVFLPFVRWVPRWIERLEARPAAPCLVPPATTRCGACQRGLRARLDILSRYRFDN